MTTTANFTNQFLIAMPTLADPNFQQTVTYLCDHNDEGAMGLIVNRPLEIEFAELLKFLKIDDTRTQSAYIPIYQGGPVQTERGFVLHEDIGGWEATMRVTDHIGLTLSQDIIEAIARGEGPQRFLIALGYAGWGAGQLEGEMAANSWLSGEADPTIIFDTPIEQRWTAAAQKLGVELKNLSPDVGHA